MVGVEQLDGMSIQEVEDLHKQAVSITAQYVAGIGAKLAPQKCRTLTNVKALRVVFRKWVVPELGQKIPVALSIRDLGAQLNTGLLGFCGVLGERISRGVACADQLAGLPVSRAQKLR
eukprot:10901728-Alexandrium_andersonii.AAC.1